LQREGQEANLTTKLELARGGRIYFGQLETYDQDDHVDSSVPIIARRNSGDGNGAASESWKAIRIDDSRLHDAAWMYVGAGPKRGEIWGVLDASLDAKQPELLVAHSTDGGATFALINLHKPSDSADFDSFCLGPDGIGRITLYISGDEDASARPGYYHFRTSDFGKTWSNNAQYE